MFAVDIKLHHSIQNWNDCYFHMCPTQAPDHQHDFLSCNFLLMMALGCPQHVFWPRNFAVQSYIAYCRDSCVFLGIIGCEKIMQILCLAIDTLFAEHFIYVEWTEERNWDEEGIFLSRIRIRSRIWSFSLRVEFWKIFDFLINVLQRVWNKK